MSRFSMRQTSKPCDICGPFKKSKRPTVRISDPIGDNKLQLYKRHLCKKHMKALLAKIISIRMFPEEISNVPENCHYSNAPFMGEKGNALTRSCDDCENKGINNDESLPIYRISHIRMVFMELCPRCAENFVNKLKKFINKLEVKEEQNGNDS